MRKLENNIIIDVGLFDGAESIGAVLKGFTVFGFEGNYKHINKIKQKIEENNIQDRYNHNVGST